jgi:hypothetical protein
MNATGAADVCTFSADATTVRGAVHARYLIWVLSAGLSVGLSLPFIKHAAQKKQAETTGKESKHHWSWYLFARAELDIYVEAIALEAGRRKKEKRHGTKMIKKVIEQYSIYLLPLEFCGWCLRSVLPMWAASFGQQLYSKDGQFLLMLDVFDYKLSIVGLCWLVQLAALCCHFGSFRMQRFNVQILLPFMYNCAAMPVIEACTHMLACSHTEGESTLLIAPEIRCWQGSHIAIATAGFLGGILFLVGGLLYKNTRVGNFLWAGGRAFYRYDEGYALTLTLAFYLMPCTSVLLQDSPWISGAVFLALFVFLLVQAYKLQPCQGTATHTIPHTHTRHTLYKLQPCQGTTTGFSPPVSHHSCVAF